jgi:hypothetical protein
MAARAGNGADGGRTTPRRTAALFRIVSLAAFAAGIWYFVGTAAAQADEYVVPPGIHTSHGHAPGGVAPAESVSAAELRMALIEARHVAAQRDVAARRHLAVTRPGPVVTGDDLDGLPVAGAAGEGLRDHVERLTSALTRGALPEVTGPWVGGSSPDPVPGRPVSRAGETGSAVGGTTSAATGTTAPRGAPGAATAASSSVAAWPHDLAVVLSGGRSLPRASVLSAWASDRGVSAGTPGKSPGLCAVAHDAAPLPVLVCTVTARGDRAPALRLRASEPPVSPD